MPMVIGWIHMIGQRVAECQQQGNGLEIELEGPRLTVEALRHPLGRIINQNGPAYRTRSVGRRLYLRLVCLLPGS